MSEKTIPGRVDELAAEIRGAHILIVDDMAIMRQMIGQCLQKGGFANLTYAVDGQDALDQIASEQPDLVVLDLNMPRVSGYEVCRILRGQEQTASLPILVQSASETPEERVQVFDSGATDFVSKPINQPELLARVCMHLENKFLIKNLSDFHASMRAELSMARDMQHSLLPAKDGISAIEEACHVKFEAHYQASFELGGDLWGCWLLADDKIGIYIVDISGHGVGAALNTFRLHATMTRFEALRHDPASFLASLNTALQPSFPLGQFATMFYGVLDYKTGELTYAGAGAPRPLVIGKGGQIRLLDSSGMPVGIVFTASYENKQDQLAPGESLFCYSDVLLEAAGPDGEFLGEDGFVAEVAAQDAKGMREALVKRVLDQFYERLPGALPDDLTAVALHTTPEGALPEGLGQTDEGGKVLVLAKDEGQVSGLVEKVRGRNFDFEVFGSAAEIAAPMAKARDLVAIVLDAALLSSEEMDQLSEQLNPDYVANGGPVFLAGDAAAEKRRDERSKINICRFIDVSHGADALYSAVCMEVEEFRLRLSVREAVERGGEELGDDVTSSVFRFQTREEAKLLASKLASTCDEERVPVAIGLTELFVNAVEHGCLAIGHEEKGRLIEAGKLTEEIRKRRAIPEYAERYVTVEFERSEEKVSFKIEDPGDGFDFEAFISAKGGHVKKHGRGITMADGCFDELTYLGSGNTVLAVHHLTD